MSHSPYKQKSHYSLFIVHVCHTAKTNKMMGFSKKREEKKMHVLYIF